MGDKKNAGAVEVKRASLEVPVITFLAQGTLEGRYEMIVRWKKSFVTGSPYMPLDNKMFKKINTVTAIVEC